MNTNNITDEKPHFMKPDSDCMGNPTPGYWRQFLACSDGSFVIGMGETPEQANQQASFRREVKNELLSKTPLEQLRQIRESAKGRYCSNDLDRTIGLILEVLLDNK